MSSENLVAYDNKLNHVKLELAGPPTHNSLVVFVQNPKEPSQYLPVHITVKSKGHCENSEKLYFEMSLINSCPNAIENLHEMEIIYRPKNESLVNGCDEDKKSVFGIANYHGRKEITIDEFIPLVASKYYQMKRAYSN